MFPLICAWINDWVNNREAGDLRRYSSHYDVGVMFFFEKAEMVVPDKYAKRSSVEAPPLNSLDFDI